MIEAPAVIRVGYKNVLGANWTRKTAPWPQRAAMLERELLGEDGMQASVYFLVEVNGRHERRSLRHILPGWDVVRTRGKNNVYSDPAVHRLLDRKELRLGSTSGQGRRVTIVDFEHLPSGICWTGATTHLSASGKSTAESAMASRAAEARTLVNICRTHGVDLLAADLNNTLTQPDRPRGILAAAGYVDWRSAIEVGNVDYNTHHQIGVPNPRVGNHIDAIYLGPRVTALSGRIQITEPDSSDHLGLVCTVNVSPR